MRARVLVVAHQTALRAKAARLLLPQGYQVELASSEKTARQILAKQQFEAAVVEPNSTAAQDVTFMRDVQNAVGKLLILTDDTSAHKRFAAYFPEALVCPSQPLDPNTLLTFLGGATAQPIARLSAGEAGIVQFEGCTLDVAGHIFLDAKGQEVTLTRREFALLVAFVGSPGRVLSRAQLRHAIDGGRADAYDRSVDMLVARLRRKIEPNPGKPQFIVTVPGGGYKFVPRVRAAPAAVQATSPTGSAGNESEVQPAERRQLTLLSCRILGFAALAATSDPEDLQNSISNVYTTCATVIARFGGTMVGGIGDNVLAYFGHPTAHENDAERAVRAALELVRAIAAVEAAAHRTFRARIGVATGVMLVGDLRYGGSAEPTAVGEALNLALHMQQAAAADSVVIAARTRQLVGSFFNCHELAPVVLEEGLEPAPAWRVIDEVAGIARFDALRREGMFELVGREPEIERLSQFWANACRGRGQVVLVTGEAGIGKSRLVIELEDRLHAEPHATVRYSGSPNLSEAAMTVLLDELQVWAGFARDDTGPQKVEKLRLALAAINLATADAMALLCGFLGLPSEPSPELTQLSAQKRKERTFAILLDRIAAMAARQPLLVVVDDAQWVDPTSLEWLTLLVERTNTLHLLLLIVGRPEFSPPWPDYSYVTALTLSRLGTSDSARLIHYVAGDRRIPAAVEAGVISRADGVPLFIEELTKAILERGARGDGFRLPQVSDANGANPIPTTLHGLLLARFDRLQQGKNAAQIGAVVGREFSYELLRMVTSMDEQSLDKALDQLVSAGLVFRRGSPAQATFVFKHALVRDAAYGTLLRERRQKLHTSIAQTYEQQFPEIVSAQPELLAYHCREAGNPVKAVGYLVAAAEQALQRSATTEALSHLTHARELIAALPETRDRLSLELKVEVTLGRALIASRGYTAPETRENYRRARAACEALGDHYWLPLVLFGHSLSAWFAADYPSALEAAEELCRWGEREDVNAGRAIGHFLTGMTLPMMGAFAAARPHLEQAIDINQFALPDRPPFLALEADSRITALMYLHTCLFALGWPEQAATAARRALIENPTQRYSLVVAQTNACRMHALERDHNSVLRVASAALNVAEAQGYPFFVGTSLVYRGWSWAQIGEAAEGVEICRGGIAKLRALGAVNWFPRYLAYLAECHGWAGDTPSALNALDEAFAASEQTGESSWQSELHRLRGVLLTKVGQIDRAETCLQLALSVARSQEARLFELRAATNLAKLLAGLGSKVRAYETLAPIYAWFTEGFDCVDLKEAKGVLDLVVDRNSVAIDGRAD